MKIKEVKVDSGLEIADLLMNDVDREYFEFSGVGSSRVVYKFKHKGEFKVVKLEYHAIKSTGSLPGHILDDINSSSMDMDFEEIPLGDYSFGQNKKELILYKRIDDDYVLRSLVNLPEIYHDLSYPYFGFIISEYIEPITKDDFDTIDNYVDSEMANNSDRLKRLTDNLPNFRDLITYLRTKGLDDEDIEETVSDLNEFWSYSEAYDMQEDNYISNYGLSEDNEVYILDIGI